MGEGTSSGCLKQAIDRTIQIKSLDWRVRKAKRISKAPKGVVKEGLAKVATLIEHAD